MSEIIASTYELKEEIGSGGGGIVYLAEHLRLNKKVILKADRRTSNARPELLRREVDVLKELSHPYIPKVYDYFTDNGTVYTVMDFIEGESLDKPLKRGEKFSQQQVIVWAKQLLQALGYLHSPVHGDPPHGFVHSDIKPANLMLTPRGNICLIDFNIALALGEENVIGCSAGYASPEHYGLDYSSGSTGGMSSSVYDPEMAGTTNLIDDEPPAAVSTARVTQPPPYKRVRPDVRSDIYSTGATLYHLFSGKRPSRNALDVKPLSSDTVSPQISAIIKKAMEPDPDRRYQTAEEMLEAFEQLHRNDPRTKRLKRARTAVFSAAALLFVVGIGTTFVGLKRMQASENSLRLAEYAENAVESGDMKLAAELALNAVPDSSLLIPEPAAPAKKALADALGVYDISDSFKSYMTAKLPSAPLHITLSPSGKTAACLCSGAVVIIDTDTSQIIGEIPASSTAQAGTCYAGENTVLFSGTDGLTAYDVKSGKVLWTGAGTTLISTAENADRVAAVHKDGGVARVYDTKSGKVEFSVELGELRPDVPDIDSFVDTDNCIFELNADGTKLAMSFSDGSLCVYDMLDPEKDFRIIPSGSGNTRYQGGFNGCYFAFSFVKDDIAYLAVVDCDKKTQTLGFNAKTYYTVSADNSGVLVGEYDILIRLDPVTGDQTPLVNTTKDITRYASDGNYTLVAFKGGFMFFDSSANLISEEETMYSADHLCIKNGTAVIGSRNSPEIRIMKLDDCSEYELLGYDPKYLHEEARISNDNSTVMLFSAFGFRLYKLSGELICEHTFDDSHEMYDQQYIRDASGSYLKVLYKDGRTLKCDAANGRVTETGRETAPDLSLNEVLLTENYRVEAPMYDMPEVYDIRTGDKLAELDDKAYLTYFTESGEYIIAQYMTTDNKYYGVLMDKGFNVLAELPWLCDVKNDELIFDYPSGHIRRTHIYSLDEHKAIAASPAER